MRQPSKTQSLPKLLVLDDDEDLLEMVTLMLSKSGLEVKSLTNGAFLFQNLAIQKPDIVLMDIYLGDIDGRSLCKQSKNHEDYSDIPIVLYSAGNISKTSITDSLADDFIQKPFDVLNLVKVLMQNLNRSNEMP